MQWTDNNQPGITFYGAGTNFAGNGVQQHDEANCWARAIGALLGVNWGFIATYAKLDDISLGQDNAETVDTVERVNIDLKKEDKPYRLAPTARWFGPSWTKQEVEAAYPRAVGLTAHWVVVLGIGFNGQGQPVAVCFWDTDNQVKYESYTTFTGHEIPELCYVRKPA